jgi:hypothetical protein
VSAQGTTGSARGDAAAAAQKVDGGDALEWLARVGLIAYGVVHLLVAWLALELAWFGGSGQSADQSGAMATLAQQNFGAPLLWVLAVGLMGLAAWQATEALRGRAAWSGSGRQRAKAIWRSVRAVAKAVVYAGLAVLAIRFATGSGQSSSRSQQETTAGILGWPGGRFLVMAAGLVLIGVGVVHVRKGLKSRFLQQIDLAEASPGAVTVITRLGQVGFPAKGVALALVGALLGYAAWTFDPEKAAGLDGAMRAVLEAPFGRVLLTLVAVGIAAFGAFCLARARYPERA